MVRIAICDDEKIHAEKIGKIVERYCAELQIDMEVRIFRSGAEFVNQKCDIAGYQIVFLDINMEEMDGIETAQVLRKSCDNTIIIFITAYMEYILTGYKVEALRYILKNDLNFKEAVEESMEAALKKIKYTADIIAVPFLSGNKKVSKNKIVYLENNGHYIDFYLLEDDIKKYSIRGSMEEVQKYLDTGKMIRIHQSYMVNLDYCTDVKHNKIILKSMKELPVSKTYSKEARNRFYEYKGEI